MFASVCMHVYKILCMNNKKYFNKTGGLMCKNKLSEKFAPSPPRSTLACILRFYWTNKTSHQDCNIERNPVLPNAKFPPIHQVYLLFSFSLVFAHCYQLIRWGKGESRYGHWFILLWLDLKVYLTRKRMWICWNCWSHNVNTNTKMWNEAKEGPKIGLTVSLRPRFASIVRPKYPFSFFAQNTRSEAGTHTSPFEWFSYLP